MEVGVVLDGRRSAAEVAELARLAETCGLAHVWLGGGARTKDHFVRLAVAAVATRRIRIGPIAVSPFEMHPAQLGLALLTLDEASQGRAAVVLGAGGDLAATLGAPRTGRVDALAECIDIVRALAGGGEVAYAGHHYRIDGLFSPWPGGVAMDRLYLAANRPRMLALAARKADGVMLTDMPLAFIGTLIDRLHGERAAAGRDRARFAISNWFVWNVQDTREEAQRLARRQLGFRLYYIREIAAAIGLDDADARELAKRQPEMVRAVFQGTAPWLPSPAVVDRLIDQLTLTADRRGVDACVARLLEFERRGLTAIALAPHGDPAAAIRLIGDAVVPAVQRDAAPRARGAPDSAI
jgi:alkanesulfonate monooxygenase SsuD/methylene tetrahydromethanopterin reductase-like flavin-dependent oxidoreductase (luciferase family)